MTRITNVAPGVRHGEPVLTFVGFSPERAEKKRPEAANPNRLNRFERPRPDGTDDALPDASACAIERRVRPVAGRLERSGRRP